VAKLRVTRPFLCCWRHLANMIDYATCTLKRLSTSSREDTDSRDDCPVKIQQHKKSAKVVTSNSFCTGYHPRTDSRRRTTPISRLGRARHYSYVGECTLPLRVKCVTKHYGSVTELLRNVTEPLRKISILPISNRILNFAHYQIVGMRRHTCSTLHCAVRFPHLKTTTTTTVLLGLLLQSFYGPWTVPGTTRVSRYTIKVKPVWI